MDTSSVYIKMSDCPEIQMEWDIIRKQDEWDCSDFVYDREDIHCSQTYCLGGETALAIETEENRNAYVWLPRQDQIQGLLKGNLTTFYWLEGLWEFTRKRVNAFPEKYADTSMEQMWLAFYMFEKHSKIWNDEIWVKE